MSLDNFYVYMDVYGICLCLCVCVHMYEYMYGGQRLMSLPQSPFTLLFETGFITELGVHQFVETYWPVSLRESTCLPCLSPIPSTGVTVPSCCVILET